MSLWPDKLISAALEAHRGASGLLPIAYTPEERRINYGPISLQQIQPASLDVRMGPDITLHPNGERVTLGLEQQITLTPGNCLLVNLVERVAIPDNVVARVEGKSTWARKFLTVHSAGFIDPGFHGDIVLELKNDGWNDIELMSGVPIAQISFQWLAAPAERPYGSRGIDSHYQGQTGATPAWQ